MSSMNGWSSNLRSSCELMARGIERLTPATLRTYFTRLANVAQLVEQLTRNEQVSGSSPLIGSMSRYRRGHSAMPDSTLRFTSNPYGLLRVSRRGFFEARSELSPLIGSMSRYRRGHFAMPDSTLRFTSNPFGLLRVSPRGFFEARCELRRIPSVFSVFLFAFLAKCVSN